MARQRRIFLILFAISGFSGLIYESIWTHYLKLFLGHAAYAQALVLAIFMGGMAIGSWLSARYSSRWTNLLLWYAFAEGIIGVCAIVFHPAFVAGIELSYSTIIPQIGTPLATTVFKWTLSSLIILPQSVLLGMTFPLMSAGLLRRFPNSPGRTIALLYFTNSIGATIGVLASGFVLIRWIGLPGTIIAAGIINIMLALTVWMMVRKKDEGIAIESKRFMEARPGSAWSRFFIMISLVTGTASFIYEIGWIRMLSLVLGTSTHAFELMLSAFILGIALGGLWIQRRIDTDVIPVKYLAGVQLIMGLLALSTLLLYGNSFWAMQWIVRSLPKTEAGYLLFNILSGGIAVGIMLPTTFLAGMTLPLITFALLDRGYGERSIGAVYSANTIGAIIGIFFAIHIGFPLLGLKGLITAGAALDILLGVILFWSIAADKGRRLPLAVTAVGAAAVFCTVLFVKLDPYKMGSGIYRYGYISNPSHSKILYHKDGKTATISCFLNNLGEMTIRTNGKTDAAIEMKANEGATSDEHTMILLAAIPMALNSEAKTAVAIGLGSGLTSHTLLSNPRIQQVDTVEIEQKVVEAAKLFGNRVDRVYADPRSHIYIDDAKSFFSTHHQKYDLIISEPSNPWVSGVSGLFSKEFYKSIRRYIARDGLFVQWVQLYEIDTSLVVSILKAVDTNFTDYAVYATNDTDIMIIAKKDGLLPSIDPAIFKIPPMNDALTRINVRSVQDIALRKIGTKKFLSKMLESMPIQANSDYYPVLDQNAAHTRFLGSTAKELIEFTYTPLPVLALLTPETHQWKETNILSTFAYSKSEAASTAMAVREYILHGIIDPRYRKSEVYQQAIGLKKFFSGQSLTAQPNERLACLSITTINIIPYLAPQELEKIWSKLESLASATTLNAEEKNWFELFKAIGRRDAHNMVVSSDALLQRADGWSLSALKFIVASNMLGSILQGNEEQSFRLWTTYEPIMFKEGKPNLLFQLLKADSEKKF